MLGCVCGSGEGVCGSMCVLMYGPVQRVICDKRMCVFDIYVCNLS